jgi:hypothetical protein
MLDYRATNQERERLESRLRALRKASERDMTKEHAPELANVMRTLQALYRRIICDPASAAHFPDTAHALWRQCFYRPIEEYRKSLKIMNSNIALLLDETNNTGTAKGNGSSSSSGKNDRDVRYVENPSHYFSRLTSGLLACLNSAAIFYSELLVDLEAVLAAALDAESKADCTQDHTAAITERETVLTRIAKSLVCLGDVERYRATYDEAVQELPAATKFSSCERLYERAAFTCPVLGAPHNQMASFAVHTGGTVLQAYRFCRAVLSAVPFPVAAENLRIVFALHEKEEKRRLLSRDRAAAGAGEGEGEGTDGSTAHGGSGSGGRTANSRACLNMFLTVQALLLRFNTTPPTSTGGTGHFHANPAGNTGNGSSSSSGRGAGVPPPTVEEVAAHVNALLPALSRCLEIGCFSGAVVPPLSLYTALYRSIHLCMPPRPSIRLCTPFTPLH